MDTFIKSCNNSYFAIGASIDRARAIDEAINFAPRANKNLGDYTG